MSDSDPECGVVFVATGPEHYLHLAEQAARSVRRTNPALAVDLFTDSPRESEAFDRIVVLEEPWHRSKIDALKTSRFAKTLYLDSDIVVVADIADVFFVLERFDIALVHDPVRASHFGLYWKTPLPNAFPTMNGGVIALRRNDRTQAFLDDWKEAVQNYEAKIDQPPLRELLWESDLRIATLPEEYNLIWPDTIRHWKPGKYSAPRIIHSPHFHRRFSLYRKIADPVSERYGRLAPWLNLLQATDKELVHREGRAPYQPRWGEKYRRKLWLWGYLPRRAMQRWWRKLSN